LRFGIVCLPHTLQSAVADAILAEQVGFDWFGVVDSQSVYRELYGTLALCAHSTSRIRLGPTVTNPVTRHPAVSATAMATLGDLANGRMVFAMGSGDSALLNLGERPARLAEMRDYLGAMRELLRGGTASYRGKRLNLSWPGHDVPLYVAAEGPKTLELAGEIADGVIVNLGLSESILHETIDRIHAGASKAKRDPAELDIWTVVRVNVCDDVAVGLDEIKMELASNAHHVFRFTLESKGVPDEMVAAIERVQRGYVPAAHEYIGGPNAALVEEPTLLDYLARRFAVVGTPDACVQRLREIASAGITNMLFTGFVRDRPRLIRALGEDVLPRLKMEARDRRFS
jgi:5,10-methylenetetrahydromethanopterin reductase